MALTRHERTRRKVDLNPLEMIEKVVSANDWPFDRTSDREIAVEVAGRWCDYRMFFSWREDVEAQHFTCAYDLRIPTERHNDIHVLLALINEKMWLGHFDLWSEEGLPMFRHAIPLRGTEGLKPERFDNYEIGAKWELLDGLLATAAVYQLDRVNTRATDPVTRLTVLTGAQRSRGLELGRSANHQSSGIAAAYTRIFG